MTHAVEQIWRDMSIPLKSYIIKRVKSEQDAEDILQDVFIKILKNINQVENREKIYHWVYRITQNSIIDYYRKSKDTQTLSEIPEIPIIEIETNEDIKKELFLCAKALIQHLPEKYQEPLRLVEFEGLTQKEVAEKLGISIPGAKSRVQRARKLVKETLSQCCQVHFDRTQNIIDYTYNGDKKIDGCC